MQGKLSARTVRTHVGKSFGKLAAVGSDASDGYFLLTHVRGAGAGTPASNGIGASVLSEEGLVWRIQRFQH